jgi:phosphoribosylanthranilate isomerase
MVKIKICGITNLRDAAMAVSLGVDALGFVFAQSPRKITPPKVRKIIEALPPFIQTVGVFVDEGLGAILDIMEFCGLDLIQLHGNEPPELCRKLMPYAIKAFRIKDETSLSSLKPYQMATRALLLDTYISGRKGGTGEAFDWKLALKATQLDIPIILSGGLGPANIEKAVSVVKPYAVDVNSGVEHRPGQKSHALIQEVINTVKTLNL